MIKRCNIDDLVPGDLLIMNGESYGPDTGVNHYLDAFTELVRYARYDLTVQYMISVKGKDMKYIFMGRPKNPLYPDSYLLLTSCGSLVSEGQGWIEAHLEKVE